MTIIKPGKLKKNLMRGTCQVCECEVEVERSETRYIEDRPGDGAHAVKCPTCKQDFLWVK